MKISEFTKDNLYQFLNNSNKIGILENLVINQIESGNERLLILTDLDNNIAAYAGFIVRHNGKIWQSKNASSYEPYKGKYLVAKLYKFVKEKLKISIQSDINQSLMGVAR